jgi:hypothetical protein
MQTSANSDYSIRFGTPSIEKKKGKFADLPWLEIFLTSLIVFFGIISALGTSAQGVKYIYFALAFGIGIPLVIFSCTHLHIGVYLVFVMSFFILGIMRWVWEIGFLPTGVLMDLVIFMLLLAMLVHVGREGSWDFAKNPIGAMILVWIGYNLAQIANPSSVSPMAWLIMIRSMAGTILFYFFCAFAFKKISHVKAFIQLWIFLSLLLAAYGLVQEFHGLFEFELKWVNSDKQLVALFYNWGHYRKFSFFSDPTTFGITVAYSAVLCIVLGLGPVNVLQRLYYFVCGGVMAMSMLFSGTRTAFALIPAGIVLLTVVTLKRNMIVMSSIFLLIFVGIIFAPFKSLGPIDSNALARFRSAFFPEDDPSFQVRLKNQAFIKPYILSHPIGAGLGSVGVFGKKYGSPLGGFATDSGFVRIAVELGWVGMILYCLLLFFVFKVGIENYHKLTVPLHKNIQVALLSVIFAIIVANYAQETILMYPTSIIFYASMAILTAMPNLEKNEL